MSEKLLDAKQVAEMLSVKVTTVYAWVKANNLPVVILKQGPCKACVRFRRSAIERWIQQRERESRGRGGT